MIATLTPYNFLIAGLEIGLLIAATVVTAFTVVIAWGWSCFRLFHFMNNANAPECAAALVLLALFALLKVLGVPAWAAMLPLVALVVWALVRGRN